ncbi:MAG: nitroreductase [Betaproteobacteria bacterium]|nr:nitroreductase [Betaproteobacteria bacterium]
MRFLVRYAILAPSTHNSQPWRFRLAGDTLELFADRGRSLPVVDPDNRGLLISCGAALFNLRTAMYYFGLAAEARPFPEPGRPDLLARIRLDAAQLRPGEWGELLRAIPLRVTNRGRFEATEVPVTLDAAMRAAAHGEGAWLTTFKTARAKQAVGRLVAEGDRIQFENAEFRRELAQWLHSARDKDGLPGYSKGIDEKLDFVTPVTAYLVRTFDFGNGVAARDRELATGSPLLACLDTARDDPLSWLNAGQALQRVLLVATARGFHASFLNQPIEVAHLRPRLASLAERKAFPQLLLRIGRGGPAKHTPRRPLEEIFIEDARAAEESW